MCSLPLRLLGVQRQSSCYVVSGCVDLAGGGSGAAGNGNGNGGGGESGAAGEGPRMDDLLLVTEEAASEEGLAGDCEKLGKTRLLGLVLASEADPPGSGTRCGRARTVACAAGTPLAALPPRAAGACWTARGARLEPLRA